MVRGTIQGRVEFVEGGDRRPIGFVVSDKVVGEWIYRSVDVAAGADVAVNLGGIGTATGTRFFWCKSDGHVKVRFQATGTAVVGSGWNVPAGGFCCGLVTASSKLYLKSEAGSTSSVVFGMAKVEL